MKRLALVLGSLLVVTAATSAKEVVPAPIVVEEAPVQIVEKEVIVYREKAPEWRPSGNLGVEARYYGKTENKDDRDDVDWTAGNNEYLRVQTAGAVNFTPEDTLDFRVRNFEGMVKEDKQAMTEKDDYRIRYTHNYGDIADTKINAKSRVEYRRREHAKQYVDVKGMFDFADYMFSNDYVKTTKFALEPSYRYAWEDANGARPINTNTLGLKLGMEHELPFGFSTEVNLYAKEHFYNRDRQKADSDKNYKRDTELAFEAYVYNTQNLYANGDVSIDFNFEGGYDPYSWVKNGYRLSDDNGKKLHAEYELYAQPTIDLTYNATKYVTLNAGVGAKYKNWAETEAHYAKNWRWQPVAYAGFNVSF